MPYRGYGRIMGKVFDEIDVKLASWIEAQPLWFVATAPLSENGHVNVSPRGHDTLSVLAPRRVAWVDYTGSGVETIAHLRENGRICLMFLSFDSRPRIVRLHGSGSYSFPAMLVSTKLSICTRTIRVHAPSLRSRSRGSVIPAGGVYR